MKQMKTVITITTQSNGAKTNEKSSQDDWVKVDSLPMNFADFRYRVVLKGLSGQEWIDKYSRILGA